MSGFGGKWRYESLSDFHQIPPVVQDHLKKIYMTLCLAVAAAAVGAYMHVLWNIGGTLTVLASVASIVLIITTPVHDENARLRFLTVAAFFQGASLGPLILLALNFDPRILVTGFVGTALAFGCFSGAAIVSKRREFLYLGGLISSFLSIFAWLQFAASISGYSTAAFTVQMYVGVLVLLGYVVFHTQWIIEQAMQGDLDYVKHALLLFTDFIDLFARILVIMMRNASDKEEDSKRKRRSWYCECS